MDNTSTFFLFTVIVAWDPVSLVLWWRNMAEYSSPYKVGLIDVGTKFAYQKLTCLAWRSSVWNKFNFCGHFFFLPKGSYFSHTLHLINLPRFKYFSVGKVCGFFVFCASVFRSARSIRPFPVFDLTFNLILDSASKNAKAWYRGGFESRPPNIPAYRLGDPGVFHSRCQSRFMDTCHTPRSDSEAKFL